MKRYLIVVMVSLMVCGLARFSAAEGNTANPEETVVRKSVTGEVTGLSSNFIAVTYGMDKDAQSALEMAFDLGKDVKIEHKKSIKEINMGDTVEVTYCEITKAREDGRKISKRAAEVVTFLRAAQQKPKTEMLDSEETVNES